MPKAPRWTRAVTLLICAAVFFSALGAAVLALLSPAISAGAQVSWPLVGFEAIVALSAALGVLFGLGRFGEAPALALACIAGTILVASGLAWQGSGKVLLGRSLTPLLLARAACSGALGSFACICVLVRDPRSWRLAGIGAALAGPAVLLALAFVSERGRRGLDQVLSHLAGARTPVMVVGAIALGAGLAAGAHLLIRAFELGRTPDEEPAPGATSSRPA